MKTCGIRSITKSEVVLFCELFLCDTAEPVAVSEFLAHSSPRLCSCYLPRKRLLAVFGGDAPPYDFQGVIARRRCAPAVSLRITGLGMREHTERILSVCSAHGCTSLAIFLSEVNADFLFSPAEAARAFDALCRELEFEV